VSRKSCFDPPNPRDQHLILCLEPVEPLVERIEVAIETLFQISHGTRDYALDIRQDDVAMEPCEYCDEIFSHERNLTSSRDRLGPFFHRSMSLSPNTTCQPSRFANGASPPRRERTQNCIGDVPGMKP